jgi:hypothetical protein
MALFIRLLGDEDKGVALAQAIDALQRGESDSRVFQVEPESLRQVPGAPFAYWVSERIRRLFRELPAFEGDGRTVRVGLQTSDDFRFVRVSWEVPVRQVSKRWYPFAKGGEYSPFYADVHLVVNWDRKGAEIRYFDRAFIRNEEYYVRPGLTWPRRTTSGLALRVMPAGCIFADKGPVAFMASDEPRVLLALLAVTNSAAFRALVALQLAAADAAARSYEVGVIQRTVLPDLGLQDEEVLADLARRAWSLKRDLDTTELTSHAFTLPALLQVQGATLAERAEVWAARVADTDAKLARIQGEIDKRCFDLYGFDPADRVAVLSASAGGKGEDDEEDET